MPTSGVTISDYLKDKFPNLWELLVSQQGYCLNEGFFAEKCNRFGEKAGHTFGLTFILPDDSTLKVWHEKAKVDDTVAEGLEMIKAHVLHDVFKTAADFMDNSKTVSNRRRKVLDVKKDGKKVELTDGKSSCVLSPPTEKFEAGDHKLAIWQGKGPMPMGTRDLTRGKAEEKKKGGDSKRMSSDGEQQQVARHIHSSAFMATANSLLMQVRASKLVDIKHGDVYGGASADKATNGYDIAWASIWYGVKTEDLELYNAMKPLVGPCSFANFLTLWPLIRKSQLDSYQTLCIKVGAGAIIEKQRTESSVSLDEFRQHQEKIAPIREQIWGQLNARGGNSFASMSKAYAEFQESLPTATRELLKPGQLFFIQAGQYLLSTIWGNAIISPDRAELQKIFRITCRDFICIYDSIISSFDSSTINWNQLNDEEKRGFVRSDMFLYKPLSVALTNQTAEDNGSDVDLSTNSENSLSIGGFIQAMESRMFENDRGRIQAMLDILNIAKS